MLHSLAGMKEELLSWGFCVFKAMPPHTSSPPDGNFGFFLLRSSGGGPFLPHGAV